METARKRKDFGYSRTVSYNSRSHLSVMLQCYGSIWRQVLPYCLFNTLLTWLLLYLLSKDIDLTVSEWGHEFMSVLVSFLLMTKFNLTLNVYYEMQTNLMRLGQATRQIVMLACCLTQKHQKAAAWRSQVAYHALALLSATVTMLTKANDLNAWEAPGVSELGQLVLDTEPSTSYHQKSAARRHGVHPRQYEAGHSLPSDVNLRVPTVLAHQLCQAITAPGSSQLDSMQVKQLTDQVELFLEGYHRIRVYLNVPLPFSVVQMARIFLFLSVFTLPFAILSADLKLDDIQVLLLVFIMTYGFMGLELVCMNLDDPFGGDPSDLPVIEQTKELMEDVYLMILRSDGLDAALRLRDRMEAAPGRPTDPTEKDGLLSSS